MLIRFILMIIFGFSSAPSLSIGACIDLTETDLSANSCQGHRFRLKGNRDLDSCDVVSCQASGVFRKSTGVL